MLGSACDCPTEEDSTVFADPPEAKDSGTRPLRRSNGRDDQIFDLQSLTIPESVTSRDLEMQSASA